MTNPEKKEPTISEKVIDEATVTTPATSAEAVANDNATVAVEKIVEKTPEVQTTTPTSTTPAKDQSKLRRTFNIAANIGVGAAATFATKLAVGALAASFAVPALATLLISSIAVGAAATIVCHLMQNRALKKRGEDTKKFFSKKNAFVFATSGGFALIGGALFLGFEEQIKGFFSSTYTAVSDFVAGKPDVAVVPVVETAVAVVPTLEDKIAGVVSQANVSSEVKEALARSASANPAVAAQGTKDLAFYAFNGVDGMPKDQTLAVELFNKAAAAGNVQAKVDVAFIQYHGLAGVAADKAAALASVSDLHTAKAEMFTKAWSAGLKAAAPALGVPSV